MKFLLTATALTATLLIGDISSPLAFSQDPAVAKTPIGSGVGERVPSEDAIIKDLHSLGLIEGHTNIFRSASPVRDLVDSSGHTAATALAEAKSRMQHLHDLGIRTIISFENPNAVDSKDAVTDEGKSKVVLARIALEKAAATEVGLNFVSRPIANSGKNSLQDMSDAEVCKMLDPITEEIIRRTSDGGVLFHCAAGHDRAGITTAYMRLKYQHWPVDQAIDEMRRYGHNWPKFSANGGISSWHEEHLKAIDKLLTPATSK